MLISSLCLYSLSISPLSGVKFVKFFFSCLDGCHFVLSTMPFVLKKLFTFMRSHLLSVLMPVIPMFSLGKCVLCQGIRGYSLFLLLSCLLFLVVWWCGFTSILLLGMASCGDRTWGVCLCYSHTTARPGAGLEGSTKTPFLGDKAQSEMQKIWELVNSLTLGCAGAGGSSRRTGTVGTHRLWTVSSLGPWEREAQTCSSGDYT